MGGTGRAALAFATNVAFGGCVVAYHPTHPHETASDGVTARVVAVDTIDNLVEMNVALGAAGTRVANAWLTTSAAGPCAGGLSPSSLSPGAIRADERVVAFNLRAPEAAGLFIERPTVIDLDLVPGDPAGARRCVRVAVTAPSAGDVEWTASPRWFAATGLRVIGAPPGDDPIHSGLLVSLGGGVWVGPLRLRLDWLVGEAGTSRPPPPGYASPRAELLGGDVAVEIFPLHVGWFGIGAQVGYEYLATDFHAQQGTNENDVYDGHGPRGPRVALRIARLPAPRGWPAFRARPDHWSMGIDLFAARWTGLPGLAPMRYGVAFSGEWGRWW